ncbi:MAG: serine/threonine-protein phosphatase [Oscillospiraceae bacterium]|jgi:serine/threonine protein phosphatase PrpC|nr:serine/threonine-protein phosphatase [Oscillospiraceae bacterium]
MYLYDGLSLQNGRNSNMDSLLLAEREIAGKNVLLAVVCDGVGSMRDGAFAASLAVKCMSEWFRELSDVERVGLRMRDEALKVNGRIIERAKENSLETAATFTAMFFAENRYYLAHIGDTRAYSFERGGAAQLTVDDVSDGGKLTACIGRFANPVFYCAEGDADGKIFLICSDGLYKRMELASAFAGVDIKRRKDVKKIIRQLAGRAIERGERDNISLALIIPKKREGQG